MARNLMLRRDLDVGKPQRMRWTLEALELRGEWRQANVKSAQDNTTDNLPQSLRRMQFGLSGLLQNQI